MSMQHHKSQANQMHFVLMTMLVVLSRIWEKFQFWIHVEKYQQAWPVLQLSEWVSFFLHTPPDSEGGLLLYFTSALQYKTPTSTKAIKWIKLKKINLQDLHPAAQTADMLACGSPWNPSFLW